jgi:hypothetical protein
MVIVDVEPTPASTYDEVEATKTDIGGIVQNPKKFSSDYHDFRLRELVGKFLSKGFRSKGLKDMNVRA